jgi:hypothetical protein
MTAAHTANAADMPARVQGSPLWQTFFTGVVADLQLSLAD